MFSSSVFCCCLFHCYSLKLKCCFIHKFWALSHRWGALSAPQTVNIQKLYMVHLCINEKLNWPLCPLPVRVNYGRMFTVLPNYHYCGHLYYYARIMDFSCRKITIMHTVLWWSLECDGCVTHQGFQFHGLFIPVTVVIIINDHILIIKYL